MKGLNLATVSVPDPMGHGPGLLLKGDWLILVVSDGQHQGLGEASHSQDDQACAARARELFAEIPQAATLSLPDIQKIEARWRDRSPDFVTATAISGLDQALHDLLARQINVPVWRLYSTLPVRRSVPFYVTVNRAVSERTAEGHLRVVEQVLKTGAKAVKCAPFDDVRPDGDQVAQSERGLAVLAGLRRAYPHLRLRVDFHKRFRPDTFARILPAIRNIAAYWLEEPVPPGKDYLWIRERSASLLAAGELGFGSRPFVDLVRKGWVDVTMPDVKHVGGFGPLLRAAAEVADAGGRVSPHNPAGAVATLASIHAAALANSAEDLEIAFHPGLFAVLADLRKDDSLRLPNGPGWGMTLEEIMRRVG